MVVCLQAISQGPFHTSLDDDDVVENVSLSDETSLLWSNNLGKNVL
jgi:hypothetical protein